MKKIVFILVITFTQIAYSQWVYKKTESDFEGIVEKSEVGNNRGQKFGFYRDGTMPSASIKVFLSVPELNAFEFNNDDRIEILISIDKIRKYSCIGLYNETTQNIIIEQIAMNGWASEYQVIRFINDLKHSNRVAFRISKLRFYRCSVTDNTIGHFSSSNQYFRSHYIPQIDLFFGLQNSQNCINSILPEITENLILEKKTAFELDSSNYASKLAYTYFKTYEERASTELINSYLKQLFLMDASSSFCRMDDIIDLNCDYHSIYKFHVRYKSILNSGDLVSFPMEEFDEIEFY